MLNKEQYYIFYLKPFCLGDQGSVPCPVLAACITPTVTSERRTVASKPLERWLPSTDLLSSLYSQMTWRPQYRSSKFRHVFGKAATKESCYDGVPITCSVQDNNFCAVNPRFLAVITECGGGGAFLVLSINHVSISISRRILQTDVIFLKVACALFCFRVLIVDNVICLPFLQKGKRLQTPK